MDPGEHSERPGQPFLELGFGTFLYGTRLFQRELERPEEEIDGCQDRARADERSHGAGLFGKTNRLAQRDHRATELSALMPRDAYEAECVRPAPHVSDGLTDRRRF